MTVKMTTADDTLLGGFHVEGPTFQPRPICIELVHYKMEELDCGGIAFEFEADVFFDEISVHRGVREACCFLCVDFFGFLEAGAADETAVFLEFAIMLGGEGSAGNTADKGKLVCAVLMLHGRRRRFTHTTGRGNSSRASSS